MGNYTSEQAKKCRGTCDFFLFICLFGISLTFGFRWGILYLAVDQSLTWLLSYYLEHK